MDFEKDIIIKDITYQKADFIFDDDVFFRQNFESNKQQFDEQSMKDEIYRTISTSFNKFMPNYGVIEQCISLLESASKSEKLSKISAEKFKIAKILFTCLGNRKISSESKANIIAFFSHIFESNNYDYECYLLLEGLLQCLRQIFQAGSFLPQIYSCFSQIASTSQEFRDLVFDQFLSSDMDKSSLWPKFINIQASQRVLQSSCGLLISLFLFPLSEQQFSSVISLDIMNAFFGYPPEFIYLVLESCISLLQNNNHLIRKEIGRSFFKEISETIFKYLINSNDQCIRNSLLFFNFYITTYFDLPYESFDLQFIANLFLLPSLPPKSSELVFLAYRLFNNLLSLNDGNIHVKTLSLLFSDDPDYFSTIFSSFQAKSVNVKKEAIFLLSSMISSCPIPVKIKSKPCKKILSKFVDVIQTEGNEIVECSLRSIAKIIDCSQGIVSKESELFFEIHELIDELLENDDRQIVEIADTFKKVYLNQKN